MASISEVTLPNGTTYDVKDSTARAQIANISESWGTSDMEGATTSTAGTHGLVPAPSAGAATRYLRSDGQWIVPPNTTYGDATTSAHGLMTASDKQKLNSIAASPVLSFMNQTLDLSKAVADSTYSDYPYKVTLVLPGVTAAYVPEVFLKTPTDVISDVCEAVYAGITFYAKTNAGTVTIDTIVCVKGGN